MTKSLTTLGHESEILGEEVPPNSPRINTGGTKAMHCTKGKCVFLAKAIEYLGHKVLTTCQ